MAKWRKDLIKEAFDKIKSLSAATKGDNSACSCFDSEPFNAHWDNKTLKEVKEHLRLYVDTWVLPPLKKALKDKRWD